MSPEAVWDRDGALTTYDQDTSGCNTVVNSGIFPWNGFLQHQVSCSWVDNTGGASWAGKRILGASAEVSFVGGNWRFTVYFLTEPFQHPMRAAWQKTTGSSPLSQALNDYLPIAIDGGGPCTAITLTIT